MWKWKHFQPKLECRPFHVTAFLNNYVLITVLIDNGSMAYTLLNETHARKRKFVSLKVSPRQLEDAQDLKHTENNVENPKVTTFSSDVGVKNSEGIYLYRFISIRKAFLWKTIAKAPRCFHQRENVTADLQRRYFCTKRQIDRNRPYLVFSGTQSYQSTMKLFLWFFTTIEGTP